MKLKIRYSGSNSKEAANIFNNMIANLEARCDYVNKQWLANKTTTKWLVSYRYVLAGSLKDLEKIAALPANDIIGNKEYIEIAGRNYTKDVFKNYIRSIFMTGEHQGSFLDEK